MAIPACRKQRKVTTLINLNTILQSKSASPEGVYRQHHKIQARVPTPNLPHRIPPTAPITLLLSVQDAPLVPGTCPCTYPRPKHATRTQTGIQGLESYICLGALVVCQARGWAPCTLCGFRGPCKSATPGSINMTSSNFPSKSWRSVREATFSRSPAPRFSLSPGHTPRDSSQSDSAARKIPRKGRLSWSKALKELASDVARNCQIELRKSEEANGTLSLGKIACTCKGSGWDIALNLWGHARLLRV